MSERLINYYRIEKAIQYMSDHLHEQPDLDTIANSVYMSPFHFQKVFTDWVGISPKKFMQYLTLDYLKNNIKSTRNMMDLADLAGLSSQSRVHDLFITIEGMSPQQYKAEGKGIEICYGYHPTPFGNCFIAVNGDRVCALKFIDAEQTNDEMMLFSRQWQHAKLIHQPERTGQFIKRIFQPDPNGESLRLLTKATSFQMKVWEALLRIPYGVVTSFGQVAQMIGQPTATRAVGAAVAANTLLYLIPCHRVIAADGTLGNYHFGKARKLAMIGHEAATQRSFATSL